MDQGPLINPVSGDTTNYLKRVEVALKEWLPPLVGTPESLHEAMHYAVFGKGKRIRPLLVYATGQLLDVPDEQLDSIACAVEFIHTYSLIHDDLPALDNDKLRRGRPTVHVAYNEALAILAGDALHTLAFATLATDPEFNNNPEGRIRIINCLANAISSEGMIGGQVLDMEAHKQSRTAADIERMFQLKTGCLIEACILMPCLINNIRTTTIALQLERLGYCLGLAFQIRDDILEVEGSTESIGKSNESDAKNGKVTYPGLVGLEQAKQRENELYKEAMAIIIAAGEKGRLLLAVAKYLMGRMQ